MNDFCTQAGSVMSMHVNKALMIILFYGRVSAAAGILLREKVLSNEFNNKKNLTVKYYI